MDAKEKQRQYKKKWEAANPEKVRAQKRRTWRRYNLRRRGLSEEEYAALHAKYGGQCAICQRRPGHLIDHDHSTGRVRGLLCLKCNTLLGMADDDARVLASALAYVGVRGAGSPSRR